MGMLVEGLNLVRDKWSSLNDGAQLGTGTTQETGQDVGLESGLTASNTTSITTTSYDQLLIKEAVFSGTTATGVSATEMVWKTSSTDKAGSRITFGEQNWNSSGDLKIKTRWYFKGAKE
jgi:hypothetical protein